MMQAAPAPAAPATAASPGLPPAAAYFPLLNADLTAAYPAGAYAGEGHNLLWEQDPQMGQVMSCDEVRRRRCFLGAGGRQR